ncbi:MAG: Inversin [candidate division TM6 bacterium GW2011_GWE2_42_60]|nr:MAG: Inversin [candidate division TM6 bacterium GW2011_GWE2_42_60]HBY05377.1 hypothetical protein [Candidatus Dependentiae bacterium]
MSITIKHFFLAALGVINTSSLWGMNEFNNMGTTNNGTPEIESKILSFDMKAAPEEFKKFNLDTLNNLTKKQDFMCHELIQEALEKDSIEAIEELMEENPKITPFTRLPFYLKDIDYRSDRYNLFERAARIEDGSILSKLLTTYADSSKHSVGDIFNKDELFYHLTNIKNKEIFKQIEPFCKTRDEQITFSNVREKLDKDLAIETLFELAQKQTCTNQEIDNFKKIIKKYTGIKNAMDGNTGNSLLFVAIESQNCEIAQILLNRGVTPDDKDLKFAQENYPNKPITLLLQGKNLPSEDKNSPNPSSTVPTAHTLPTTEELENKWYKDLHQKPTDSQFLELPAKIDVLGFKAVNKKYIDLNNTSLICDAALNCSAKSVQELLEIGADVNERVKINGTVVNTPLYAAVLNFTGTDTCMYNKCSARDYSIALVKLLIEKGAKATINTPVEKEMTTPLIAAIARYPQCSCQNLELVTILIKNGAHVSLQDSNGDSPLHHAAKNLKDSVQTFSESSNQAICRFLLFSGANLELKNKNGLQPYQIAGCISKEEWIKQLYPDENDIPKSLKQITLPTEEEQKQESTINGKSPLNPTLYFGLSKNQLIGAGAVVVSLGAVATWYLYTRITHQPFVPRFLNSISSRTKLWWKWATTRSQHRLTTPTPFQFS